MHFWVGRDAHPLKAGVAAVLAVDLCKALKRHARPFREDQGEESSTFLSLFPKGLAVSPGGLPHGFRHSSRPPHVPRLLAVELLPPVEQHTKGRAAAAQMVQRSVPLAKGSVHEGACFILDLEHRIVTYIGENAPISVRAKATQAGAGWPAEDTGAFWAAVEELGGDGVEEGDEERALAMEPVLHRVDDLQDELEVVEVHKGPGMHTSLLEQSRCMVLDSGASVFVWKGSGATLDARVGAERFARHLAGERTLCTVVVLPQDTPNVLFASHLIDHPWLVYTSLPPARIAPPAPPVAKLSASNKAAPAAQPGALVELKAWSIINFELEAVTEETLGHFASDRCYLVQCTYRADGNCDVGTPATDGITEVTLLRRADGPEQHVFHFWRGWSCSRVEALCWQYDIMELMAKRIELQTGSKPVQINMHQGKVR
ncbi:hypothetical protein T484DRAFT_1813219 [Baffinella frigidus]|nr:hypothetical protein T484DRAFT_1813219 [Cryptophyta sp. CCMP2293]